MEKEHLFPGSKAGKRNQYGQNLPILPMMERPIRWITMIWT